MKKTKIITGILSAAMVASVATPAFAAGEAVEGTEANPVKAAITKVLETGEKTETPNATFTFNFEQVLGVTQDDAGNPIETTDTQVAIPSVTAAMNSSKTGTDPTADNKKVVEVQTADFLENVTFPNAGIYVYKVTEAQSGYTIADSDKETLVYSGAEYTMYVYVANKTQGTGTYVKALGTVLTKDDKGLSGTDSDDPRIGAKVDPTPNPNPTTDGSVSANNSKMTFTNTYIKQPGKDIDNPDPTDPNNQMLSVGKTVAGDLGDLTQFFKFSVQLEKLAIQDAQQTYKGYIMNANNQLVAASDLAPGLTNPMTFTTGTAQDVDLKHGQKIVFTDVPVGTHFTATETTVAGYTPSAVITEDGTAITTKNVAVQNTEPAGRGVKGGADVVVGENKSGIQVTNTFNDTTPTGILMNNRPAFIAMIVAIGAGVTAVVVGAKFKKKRVR